MTTTRLAQGPNGQLVPDNNYTVQEACAFLPCPQPVPMRILQQLGKDCSMLCKVRGYGWALRPTPGKEWPNERAYPFEVIKEVFLMNPDTAPYVRAVTQ
jgi:hypothetical protein